MTPGTHVTLAVSTGLIWLMLVVHVLGGTTALVSGFGAVIATKGSRLHRRAGLVFVISMLVMAVFAAIVAAYEVKATFVSAVLTAYLVVTGFTTVRPVGGAGRTQHVALMGVALLVAVFNFALGIIALGKPHGMIDGVPAAMILFMATIALLAATGDWRMIRAGGITGTRKLARHLWRMCFALFIASGSFFLGQMKFVPQPLRMVPLMAALGFAPLFVLLYWLWRVQTKVQSRSRSNHAKLTLAAEPRTTVRRLQ